MNGIAMSVPKVFHSGTIKTPALTSTIVSSNATSATHRRMTSFSFMLWKLEYNGDSLVTFSALRIKTKVMTKKHPVVGC